MPTSRPNARSSSAICSYWDARSAKSKAQVRLPGRKVAAHVGTTGQQAMGDQGCPYEAAIRHYWLHQAESALQRFDDFDPQPMQ